MFPSFDFSVDACTEALFHGMADKSRGPAARSYSNMCCQTEMLSHVNW